MIYLYRLRLRNFRNFLDQTVEFPPEGAALIGDNGQGKTNLLEAVYYLEVFRSFRGARDDELVTFGADHFRVEGTLEGAEKGGVAVAAGYSREGRRKKVTLNGNEPDRLADAIGQVGAVVFTASDVAIVRGGPGARRRFLDILLSLVEPGYLASLQRYRHTVTQRNELLRNGGQHAPIAAWDEGLVEHGSRLMEARARWVGVNRATFAGCYGAISGGDAAGFDYEPAVASSSDEGSATDNASREYWAHAFRRQLARLAARERRRGMTMAGPHRDDLRFWTRAEDGRAIDLRAFGSAGQQRTAALALRMAEAETMRQSRGHPPILMLDDVFAELDPRRAERVLELTNAGEWGQILVTSPKPDEFARLGGRLPEYRVEDGRVRAA